MKQYIIRQKDIGKCLIIRQITNKILYLITLHDLIPLNNGPFISNYNSVHSPYENSLEVIDCNIKKIHKYLINISKPNFKSNIILRNRVEKSSNFNNIQNIIPGRLILAKIGHNNSSIYIKKEHNKLISLINPGIVYELFKELIVLVDRHTPSKIDMKVSEISWKLLSIGLEDIKTCILDNYYEKSKRI